MLFGKVQRVIVQSEHFEVDYVYIIKSRTSVARIKNQREIFA